MCIPRPCANEVSDGVVEKSKPKPPKLPIYMPWILFVGSGVVAIIILGFKLALVAAAVIACLSIILALWLVYTADYHVRDYKCRLTSHKRTTREMVVTKPNELLGWKPDLSHLVRKPPKFKCPVCRISNFSHIEGLKSHMNFLHRNSEGEGRKYQALENGRSREVALKYLKRWFEGTFSRAMPCQTMEPALLAISRQSSIIDFDMWDEAIMETSFEPLCTLVESRPACSRS